MSHHTLTGLYNRWAFEGHLSGALQRVRTEGAEHTLCFVDLDQFKFVNDTSGHFAGDHMLREVVEVFRATLSEGDVLARLGGDEFGIIFKNGDLGTAASGAGRNRKCMSGGGVNWQG